MLGEKVNKIVNERRESIVEGVLRFLIQQSRATMFNWSFANLRLLFMLFVVNDSQAVLDVMQFCARPRATTEDFFLLIQKAQNEKFQMKCCDIRASDEVRKGWRTARALIILMLDGIANNWYESTKKPMWLTLVSGESRRMMHWHPRSATLNACRRVILVNRLQVRSQSWRVGVDYEAFTMCFCYSHSKRHHNHNGLMALIKLLLIPRPHHMSMITCCCCYVSANKMWGERATKGAKWKLRIMLERGGWQRRRRTRILWMACCECLCK